MVFIKCVGCALNDELLIMKNNEIDDNYEGEKNVRLWFTSPRCRSTPVEDRVSRSSRVRSAPTSCRAFLVRTLPPPPKEE